MVNVQFGFSTKTITQTIQKLLVLTLPAVSYYIQLDVDTDPLIFQRNETTKL